MLTRVMKAALVVMAAGLFGAGTNPANAFWGHRQVVTTNYAPAVVGAPVVAAAPVVTGYAPAYATTSYSLPSVPAIASPVVVSRPVVTAAPAVTSYYAPATTAYYAPATTAYYAPAAPAVTSY